MKTEEIRDLERAVTEHPGDDLAVQALELARVRRGLGWHGEELPPRVFPAEERGVYRFRVTYTGDLEVQLVYVPGQTFYVGRHPVTWGEIQCAPGLAQRVRIRTGDSRIWPVQGVADVTDAESWSFCDWAGLLRASESQLRFLCPLRHESEVEVLGSRLALGTHVEFAGGALRAATGRSLMVGVVVEVRGRRSFAQIYHPGNMGFRVALSARVVTP